MIRVHQRCAFASMAEVLVTAVIFVLAAVGIFATISMLRPHGMESKERLEAAYIGKSVIEELRGYVDARVWDNADSPLAPGTTHTEDIGNYVVSWDVSPDDPELGVRYLTMNVSIKE